MNKHEITVISNSPANDIHEFVRTCGIFVESYRPNEIILKSGNILKFCSDPKLPGIRNYYYYKEVFESYLKQYIRHLENQNVEQDKEIHQLNNIINEYENMKKELLDYIYHNEYCRFGHIDGGEADEMRNILKRTDKLKELKESEK